MACARLASRLNYVGAQNGLDVDSAHVEWRGQYQLGQSQLVTLCKLACQKDWNSKETKTWGSMKGYFQ